MKGEVLRKGMVSSVRSLIKPTPPLHHLVRTLAILQRAPALHGQFYPRRPFRIRRIVR